MQAVAIAAGHWLDAGPAASWARMRRAGMPAGGITEAGRTRARQEYLYAQYLAGKLIAYAAKPGTSKHETGRAVDMSTTSAAHAWLLVHGAEHGWTRPLLRAAKPEPWHWEYSATIDRHLTDGTDPVRPITPKEDNEMPETDETRGNIFEIRKYLGIMERNIVAAIERGFEQVAAAIREGR